MRLWKIKFAFALVILLAPLLTVHAQRSRIGFSPVRTFDALHYSIDTKFDRRQKMIFGETTVKLKPLRDKFRSVELDSVGLSYVSVSLLNGTPLKFSVSRESVKIALDKDYARNDTIGIKLIYSSKPSKGVYFVDASKRSSNIVYDAQVWTQGETAETRHWFPSYDFPDDKATTEQFITVEEGETAIANGELIGIRPNSDGTRTFHFSMKVPHSTYLTSLVVGNYKRIDETYRNVALGYFIYPDHSNIFRKAFGKTREMMRVFEEVTGIDYPFNKYDQTLVAKFELGGMENITATTLSDREILLADFPTLQPGVEDLVAHELAHSWFGNLVTCKNWSELWLNEGFATFMEAVFRERMNGRSDYIQKIQADVKDYFADDIYKKNPHGVFNRFPDLKNDESMFDSIVYQKAGAVIHTLRETVGDDAFWHGVKMYLRRHRGGNVETSDLKKAMEEASKTDLDWFFDQWVYGGGYPKINIDPVFYENEGRIELDISQIQKSDALVPEAFIIPLEIELEFPDGRKAEMIRITKKGEKFNFPADTKPVSIVIDPAVKIPLKRVKVQKIKTR